MLRDLNRNQISFSFSTNGIGFEKFAHELAELEYLNHVNISIDSPDPSVYKEIRGGDLHRALAGARAIADALRNRTPKIPVTVAAVIMKSNAWSLLGFPPLLQEMGIRHLVLGSLQAYKEDMMREHLHTSGPLKVLPDAPPMPMFEIVGHLNNLCQRHDIVLVHSERLTFDSYLPVDSEHMYFGRPGDGRTRACAVPFEHMYLDAAGRVFPCCHAASGPVLGELKDGVTLNDIWNGDKSRAFRQAILRAETTPPVCQDCTIPPLGEHPMAMWSAEMETAEYLAEGGVRLRVKNTGTQTWTQKNPLSLGTARPLDRESGRRMPSWPGGNRVAAMKEQEVGPGQLATLEFEMGPNASGGPEFFKLLVEGKLWLYNTMHSYQPHAAVFADDAVPAVAAQV
jgi:radical SAM protein with 4Fe4S-binding SPASM domain